MDLGRCPPKWSRPVGRRPRRARHAERWSCRRTGAPGGVGSRRLQPGAAEPGRQCSEIHRKRADHRLTVAAAGARGAASRIRVIDTGIGIAEPKISADLRRFRDARPQLCPRTRAAPGWAWASRGVWCAPWVARSASRASRARAACSGYACRLRHPPMPDRRRSVCGCFWSRKRDQPLRGA